MTITRPLTQSLNVHVAPTDTGGVGIVVNGDLDVFTVDHLTQRFTDLLGETAPTTIELDLAGVGFIDAAATFRLRALHTLATTAGFTLSITAASQFAWWLFHTFGLNSVFPAPARCRWASEPGS